MAEAPRKRSRFDQTEPEPKRSTRFDRRSRSPSGRASEPRRSRSPLSTPSQTAKQDPAAAAAAAAARINAQIEQRKGIQPVDVPPIRTVGIPSRTAANHAATITDTYRQPSAAGGAKSPNEPSTGVNGDIYQQDGDYIKDIEVNDLRNRYTLTKGSTQKMVIILSLPKKTDLSRHSPPSFLSNHSETLPSWSRFVLNRVSERSEELTK